jgi:3-oxoacyl-[acyl-carrier protein] reductase
LAFAEAGAAVVIAEINAEMGQRTVREISTGVGVKAQFIATDVSSKESVMAMVDTAVTTFGHVDILVNNAAGDMASQPTGAAIEMSESGFESDLRLCLTSVFTCSKAVARVMLEQKAGSIINISSRESQMPSVGLLAYGAAKSGVNSLTKTLAWELAPHVRVNAILPGCIWTEVAAQRLGPFKDQIIAATPL